MLVVIRGRMTAIAGGLLAATMIAGCSGGSGSQQTTTESAPPRPTSSAPTTTTPTSHAPTVAQVRARIGSQLKTIMKHQQHGAISVAALNTKTGQRFTAGQNSGMWTASAYKLFCLSAILLHQSASSLSGSEVDSAQRAIENSDNVAGYQLFLDAGGRSGLESAADAFGMSHTVPGESDPTFTTTSGADYLKLLEAITGQVKHDPLSASDRSFILDLMGRVESDQRWGVGAAAQKGTKFYNKNGWLSIDDGNGPGEEDGGLWAVTSVGVLTVHGQRVLMAVFTKHQPDFDTGVALTNRLSRLIAPAVAR